MATIKFILKTNSAPASIYIRLIDGRNVDVMAKTNYAINPSDWNTEKRQPKNSRADLKNLTADLQELKAALLKHYNKCNGRDIINTAWLKEFINPSKSNSGLPDELSAYIEHYIAAKRKSLRESSIKKINVLKHKLARYEKQVKKVVFVKDVNREFQASFEKYCTEQGYAANTIARDVRFIKTICRHAKDNGIDTHHQLDGLKVEYIKVDSIYLNWQEIELIKKADLNKHLDNVRDWLLISCYCGQRISDFMRFDETMLRTETNRTGATVMLIEFVQQKTGKIMTLPVHSEILRILEKREGKFPEKISSQKYNEHIKTVCEKAGIVEMVRGSKRVEVKPKSKIYRKETGVYPKHELVTSHIGRRSFASNFYGTIPTSLLIAATGHSTEAMFLNYIGKSSSDRAKELSEYF